MKIYVFGNPLIREDNLPLQLISQLKKSFPKIKFLAVDPNENFPPKGEKDLVILDTVKGIKKPTILSLEDFDIKKKTSISPHDYDLLIHLLLLKKMKKIENVKIVGIPFDTTFDRTGEEVAKIISTLPLKNAPRKTYRGQRRGLIFPPLQ